ncbi:MAG: hypothetical protein AAGA28_16285 [Pseudomonadota bacterium]
MDMLIWSGAFVTLAGLTLLIWCILRILAARRAKLDDEALRAELRRILPLNSGALLLSMFGLILVVVGILLG